MGPSPDPCIADAVAALARDAMRDRSAPLVLGLCGAQGSGKSTLAAALTERFEAEGVATAILSLDDLYRTRAERGALARSVHPLFRTRGVPGTHDVALGLAALAAMDAGDPVLLPRFDKASDDRAPRSQWPRARPDTRLILFEGWCVGARPQPEEALAVPVNDLEANADADGAWRRAVNAALSGTYQDLFARIDRLVLLAAPGFGQVPGWRRQQEAELRARTGNGMDDAEVARFIQHYERLTRHILDEMPARADLVIRLAPDRSTLSIG